MGTPTKDLHIFESGSGGELALLKGDLALAESFFQVIYIALFGGNVEASTKGNEVASQERFDYWANSLIYKDKKAKQFNSETERVISETTINSSGRLKIKRAVEEDLAFLKKIANLEINIVLLSDDKISIEVLTTALSNQTNRDYQFIWDNAKKEVIINETI